MPTAISKYKVTTGFVLDEGWSGIAFTIPIGAYFYVADSPYATVCLKADGTQLFSVPGEDLVNALLTGPYAQFLLYEGEVSAADVVLFDSLPYFDCVAYREHEIQALDAQVGASETAKEVLSFTSMETFSSLSLSETGPPELIVSKLSVQYPNIPNIPPVETQIIFSTQNVPIATNIEKPDGSKLQVRHGTTDLVIPLDQSGLLFTTSEILNRQLRIRTVDFSEGAQGAYLQMRVQQSLTADSAPTTNTVFSVSDCTGATGP